MSEDRPSREVEWWGWVGKCHVQGNACSSSAAGGPEHRLRGAGQMEEEKMRACGYITKMASMCTVVNAAVS